MTVSDRIVIMRNGSIVQDGAPEQIYSSPANSFVANFIGHSNLISAHVSSLEPVILDFLGGSFYCHEIPGLYLNQEVKVLLRPDVIAIQHDSSKNEQNLLAGQVIDATFKGSYMDYLIEVAEAHLNVHYPIRNDTRSFSIGDRIFLSWLPENALILSS